MGFRGVPPKVPKKGSKMGPGGTPPKIAKKCPRGGFLPVSLGAGGGGYPPGGVQNGSFFVFLGGTPQNPKMGSKNRKYRNRGSKNASAPHGNRCDFDDITPKTDVITERLMCTGGKTNTNIPA